MTRDEAIKRLKLVDLGEGRFIDTGRLVDALVALGVLKLHATDEDEGSECVRYMSPLWARNDPERLAHVILEDLKLGGFKIVKR